MSRTQFLWFVYFKIGKIIIKQKCNLIHNVNATPRERQILMNSWFYISEYSVNLRTLGLMWKGIIYIWLMFGLRISWKFGIAGKFLLHCKMVLSYWISHNFCIIVGSSFSYEISCPVCSLKAKHANNNCFSLQVGTFHHKPTISESDRPSNEHFAVRKVFPHQLAFSCWLFWGSTKYL